MKTRYGTTRPGLPDNAALLLEWEEATPGTGRYSHDRDGYTVLSGEFGVYEYDQGAGERRFTRPTEYGHPVPYLPSLKLRAQASNTVRDGEKADRAFYAHEVQYVQHYEVSEDTAEAMLLTLRRVRAGLKKIEDREGVWKSEGQWIARLCVALGIKQVVMRSEEGYRRATGSWMRCMNPAEAASHVDHLIYDYRRRWAEIDASRAPKVVIEMQPALALPASEATEVAA